MFRRLHIGHYVDRNNNVLINDETLYEQAKKILRMSSDKKANSSGLSIMHLAGVLTNYIIQLEENSCESE